MEYVWGGGRGEGEGEGDARGTISLGIFYLVYVISESVLWVSQLYFCPPQQNGKEINPQDLAGKKKSAMRGSYQLKVTENGTG